MASNTDDLDELLDSALDDFQNLNVTSTQRNNDDEEEEIERNPTLPTNVQGLGLGLPDLKSKKKGKKAIDSSPKETHISETLDKLRQQTREAVKNLESISGVPEPVDDLGKDATMDEWVKQFEELAGSQDMGSIVETMMQHLLSKEILYEPMKEIGERYPIWLDEHKSGLTEEDYKRYSHQYELIQELNGVYDNDPGNFTKIVELMQKMQECGHPPNDIVRELAPDFDMTNLGQMSPEMLEAQQNCCIM